MEAVIASYVKGLPHPTADFAAVIWW